MELTKETYRKVAEAVIEGFAIAPSAGVLQPRPAYMILVNELLCYLGASQSCTLLNLH